MERWRQVVPRSWSIDITYIYNTLTSTHVEKYWVKTTRNNLQRSFVVAAPLTSEYRLLSLLSLLLCTCGCGSLYLYEHVLPVLMIEQLTCEISTTNLFHGLTTLMEQADKFITWNFVLDESRLTSLIDACDTHGPNLIALLMTVTD